MSRRRTGARSVLRRSVVTTCVLGLFVVVGLAVFATDSFRRAQGHGEQVASAPHRSANVVGAARVATEAADTWAAQHEPDSEFGFAVIDQHTGEVATSERGAVAQYSASLIKVAVAVDLMERNQHGLLLTGEDRMLLKRALGASDDEAMNELWDRYDGAAAVRGVAARARLGDTRPAANPAQWGETLISARDGARLVDYAARHLPPIDSRFLLDSLATGPGIGFGGFDQRFGLRAVADGPRPAVKAGWMCCQHGKVTMHSIGLVRDRYAVAILSTQPASHAYPGGRATVTSAARVLLDELD